MEKNTAIKVENLSKIYRIGEKENRQDTIVSSIFNFLKSPLSNYRKYRSLYKFDDLALNPSDEKVDWPVDVIWALRNVDFEIQEGEVVGVIGRNGAGKSTLLKILSRITYPTSGCVEIRGRVSSLLEVGTGFHPELTGRENVYLNGTILGMRKREIDQKFDEIVAFSEVEKFLDTPVKRYSSGMRVRLAFSVAAHLEPEILLIDEVLAVGDLAFQKKCLGKMEGVAEEGRTVMFVSHNMGMISELCPKCIHMENGKVIEIGDSRDIVARYSSSGGMSGKVDLREWSYDRKGKGPMQVLSLTTRDDTGTVRSQFEFGEPITFSIGVSGKKDTQCIIGLSIRDPLGHLIMHFSNIDDDAELMLPSEETEIQMRLEKNILNDGTYFVTVWLGDGFNMLHDRVYNCLNFNMESKSQGRIVSVSPIRLPAAWEVLRI